MKKRLLVSPARLVWCLVLALFAATLAPGAALAHPDLEQAKRLASDLEFDAALSAFDKALASGTLSRDDLIQLLAERALVLHALRRKDALVSDFVWLSALAPDFRLDLRAAPELTALWTSIRDQGRGPLRVALVQEPAAAGEAAARAELRGTVPEGARARLFLRREGGSFSALPLPELRESGAAGATLEVYAQALALGDVVVAQDGDASDPLRLTLREGPTSSASGSDERGPSWAKRNKGWLIGGAALVVVAAAVVTGVLVAQSRGSSDQTDLHPMVSF
ncbi:MAG TPA: hypothetical protein VFZ61_34020 [Polyangiales bacterium]